MSLIHTGGIMSDESRNSTKLTGIKNRLGFRPLEKYLELQSTFSKEMENAVLSPLSMNAALGMVYHGAGDNTKRCITETFGNVDIDATTFSRSLQASIEAFNNIRGLEIAIANSLWVKRGVSLKEKFQTACRDYFSAEVYEQDFSSPDALNIINEWVKNATQGNIPTILEKISPSTVLFIINAVFFKGTWANQFDPHKTRTGTFHSLKNAEIQCQFMNQSGKYDYLQTEIFKAARLPYQDERFAMFLFLPTQRTTQEEAISTLQDNLKTENWQGWLEKFHEMEGNITMPRISLDCDMDLKETLIALGMGDAFNQSRADFSEMCESPADVFISDVKHKTRLDVNEEGTVAAAATKVTMMSKSMAMRFSMILDRPFFFAIHDRQSGALLFIGWIVNPNSSSTK